METVRSDEEDHRLASGSRVGGWALDRGFEFLVRDRGGALGGDLLILRQAVLTSVSARPVCDAWASWRQSGLPRGDS